MQSSNMLGVQSTASSSSSRLTSSSAFAASSASVGSSEQKNEQEIVRQLCVFTKPILPIVALYHTVKPNSFFPSQIALIKVASTDHEFSIVNKAFFDKWNAHMCEQPAQIVSLYRVQNAPNELRFVNKKRSIKQARGEPNAVDLVWHATGAACLNHRLNPGPDCALCGILRNGFNKAFANPRGYFGKGFYFAQNPGKAHMYGDRSENVDGIRAMFACEVVMGNTFTSLQYLPESNIVEAPKGYDSLTAPKGTGSKVIDTEYVVYEPEQIRVEYLLFYTYHAFAHLKTPIDFARHGIALLFNMLRNYIPQRENSPMLIISSARQWLTTAKFVLAWNSNRWAQAAKNYALTTNTNVITHPELLAAFLVDAVYYDHFITNNREKELARLKEPVTPQQTDAMQIERTDMIDRSKIQSEIITGLRANHYIHEVVTQAVKVGLKTAMYPGGFNTSMFTPSSVATLGSTAASSASSNANAGNVSLPLPSQTPAVASAMAIASDLQKLSQSQSSSQLTLQQKLIGWQRYFGHLQPAVQTDILKTLCFIKQTVQEAIEIDERFSQRAAPPLTVSASQLGVFAERNQKKSQKQTALKVDVAESDIDEQKKGKKRRR